MAYRFQSQSTVEANVRRIIETLDSLTEHYASVLEENAFATLDAALTELHLKRLRQLIDQDEPMATTSPSYGSSC
jgi:regulator of replication initiation timing